MPAALSELDAATFFNSVEAAWWFLMAGAVMLSGQRFRGTTPSLRFTLACLLAAFGVSDMIEIRTGAWWRPTGLLLLKATCLTGLLVCALVIMRRLKMSSR